MLTPNNAAETLRKLGGIELRKANEPSLTGEVGGTAIVLYGQGGAGKTLLASGAADSPYGSPCLHIDAEGGSDVIEHKDNVDVAEVFNWTQYNNLTDDIIRQKGAGYKCIINDNLVELCNMCLEKITGTRDAPEIQEWGEMFREIRHKIRQYRDLARKFGIVIIFCCWDAIEKTVGNQQRYDLALTPALRKQVPGLITIVGHITVLEDPYKRLLDFASTPNTVSKLRAAPSTKAAAAKIPLRIVYPVDKLPMVDILGVLKGGKDWPTGKYEIPAANPAARVRA